jgi:hypothetical protein
MQPLARAIISSILFTAGCCAQATFTVTGSSLPDALLKLNYGALPKGIRAFDLSICNLAESKQSLVSSQIYQALAQGYPGLQPIGGAIMLAAILHNRNHSLASILNIALGSVTSILSVVGTAQAHAPPGLLAGAALGSLAAQQLIGHLAPVLTADQVERFASQVLEPALVLDGGSCVERTMFATTAFATTAFATSAPQTSPQFLSFHVR